MTSSFDERPVAIVTGAASGIGQRMVAALHRDGYRLVAVDVDRAALDRSLAARGLDVDRAVMARTLDVRSAAGWDDLVAATVERFGRLDVLLNVAGVLRAGYIYETDAASLDLQIDVNVKGVMHGTRAASRQMVQQGRGHIVNVASIAGVSHVPGLSGYCASKHAVRGFTLSVAHELSAKGVAVTVFCPDAVETPMLVEQENRPEAAMTFGSLRALRLDEVEAALLGVLRDRPLEVVLDVPFSGRAFGAKLANMFPRLTAIAAERIIREGRAKQEQRTRRS